MLRFYLNGFFDDCFDISKIYEIKENLQKRMRKNTIEKCYNE